MKRADLSGELERIRLDNGGRLTPDAVVAVAQDKKSPLHAAFTWDNDKAGHEYRLWQARQLIKSVTISHDCVAPAYVNVRIANEQYYQRTEVAVKNVDEWQSALSVLAAKLEGIQLTLERLEDVADSQDKKKRVRIARKGVKKAAAVVNG